MTIDAMSPTISEPQNNNRNDGNLKTRMCRARELCNFGAKCRYAHNEAELRSPASQTRAEKKITRVAFKKAMGKPQMDFKLYDEKAANADFPFKPILKTKHHARSASPVNAHPYEFELNNWKIPAFQLSAETPIEPQKIEEKPVKMITTKEQLVKLVHVLNGQAAFAVDLEHHNYRSYRGFTCLIQISTRDKDYIVDPFPLWHEMHILNEPFTNPNILKVFHGAHWDMEWLQRDFGIYVVNMFDTQAAMRILEFSKFSLAHLVQHYCDVTLVKEFQKSDWRLRPLPIEHIQYARSDTHYLLYCYDMLRNELIKKDGLKEAYDDSKKICLTEYKTPIFKANDYEKFLPIKVPFNNRQKFVVEKLWTWRDLKARRFDESTEFVLPKAAVFRIANDFPRTNSELEKIVVGSSYLLKKSLKEILQFIADASSLPLEKPQDKNESGGESFDFVNVVVVVLVVIASFVVARVLFA